MCLLFFISLPLYLFILINTHVYDYLLKDFSLKLAYNTNHMKLTQLALRILYQLICLLYVLNNIYLHWVRLLKLIRGGLQHNTDTIQILQLRFGAY